MTVVLPPDRVAAYAAVRAEFRRQARGHQVARISLSTLDEILEAMAGVERAYVSEAAALSRLLADQAAQLAARDARISELERNLAAATRRVGRGTRR